MPVKVRRASRSGLRSGPDNGRRTSASRPPSGCLLLRHTQCMRPYRRQNRPRDRPGAGNTDRVHPHRAPSARRPQPDCRLHCRPPQQVAPGRYPETQHSPKPIGSRRNNRRVLLETGFPVPCGIPPRPRCSPQPRTNYGQRDRGYRCSPQHAHPHERTSGPAVGRVSHVVICRHGPECHLRDPAPSDLPSIRPPCAPHRVF